jgi:hypothetical protein
MMRMATRSARRQWFFETTCVNSDGPSINAMQSAAAVPITYRTLKKHLGQALVEVEASLGYDTGSERGGLRMSKDWAVSYARSVYRGRPCLYFAWSRIEHIFLKEES